MIQISLLNPVRLVNINNINDSFDGEFSIKQFKENTVSKCYYQKWQTSDVLKLQVLSTTEPTDLLFRDRYDTIVLSVPWQASTRTIVDYPDLKIYEIELAILSVPEGEYYMSFEEDNDTYISEPIRVAFRHEGTKLIKYTNSVNNYDVVFDTGIEFQFRCEIDIRDFVPKNDREVYTDQIQNPTQLFSVAYRNFTLFIGSQRGVADWVLDKVNQISQCDQVSFNDVPYQITDGSEWEVVRLEQYFFRGATTEIQPVDNNFNKYTTIPDQSEQTFTPVQKVTPLPPNGSGNQQITGVFGISANLEKIIIYKNGADYILNVGVTPGGNEIGSFEIDESANVDTVEWTFTGNSTVYLSGTGLNYTLCYLVWKQLDEAPVPIGTGPVPPPLAKGACIIYEEVTPGDFLADFDISTGLGRTNSNWADWVLSGSNGTVDRAGKFPIGWDRDDDADMQTINTQTGSATITITKASLPAEGVAMFVNEVNNTGGAPGANQKVARARSNANQALNYEISGANGSTATVGISGNLGSGEALPYTPLSIVSVYVVKIR